MEEAFWVYWRGRWPFSNCDEKVLSVSANFRETRAAFFAGWEAKEKTVGCTCYYKAGESIATCPVHSSK